MYWPYLRSKQEELLALRELGNSNLNCELLIPIIKLHSASSRLEKQISTVLQAGLRIALIVNTNEGEPVPSSSDVEAMEVNLTNLYPGQVYPTLEIRPDVTIADVNLFINTYSERKLVFMHRDSVLSPRLFPDADVIHVFEASHCSEKFISEFTNSHRVILRDGFKKQQTNGQYPLSSYFDDLAYTYKLNGFQGFGDFAAIGDIPFKTGGGQPSHVALHLTESQQKSSFICNHFVSSTANSIMDVATMYFDAEKQLITYTTGGNFNTFGVADFIKNNTVANYPGLGSPKRWSTKHHIELMLKNLKGHPLKT